MTTLALAALLSLAAPPSARAQWALDSSTVSATDISSETAPDGSATPPFEWDVDNWPDFIYGEGDGVVAIFGAGGGGSASISATQTFVFRWTGDGPPPEKAYFLVTGASAVSEADAGSGYQSPYDADFPSGLISGELGGMSLSDPDDGLGDKPVETTVYDADPGSVWGPRYGWHRKVSSSRGHLLQKDGSSGQVTVSVTGSAGSSGSSTNQTYRYLEDDLYGSINPITVAPDTRAVTISSSIEDSYYKGSYDSQHGTDRYVHQRNSDGSMSADAGVSWNDASTTGWIGSGQFTADASGFDNPTYAWSATGGTVLVPPSHIGYDEQSIPISIKVADSVSGLPAQSTVKVDVTDGPGTDGATGSASYNINWHLPYEKNQDLGGKLTKHIIMPRIEGIEPDASLIVEANPAGTIDFAAAIDAVAVALPMVGATEKVVGLTELVGKIAGITKWEYDYQEGVQLSVANDAQAWHDAEQDQHVPYVGNEPNIPPNLEGDDSNYFLCKLDYDLVEYDRDESWYADGYNRNGYDGNSMHLITSHKVDNVVSERYFTQFRNWIGGKP